MEIRHAVIRFSDLDTLQVIIINVNKYRSTEPIDVTIKGSSWLCVLAYACDSCMCDSAVHMFNDLLHTSLIYVGRECDATMYCSGLPFYCY